MKGDVLMNQKNDKEILFRGDPIVQIMATPHPGNKIIYLNEEAINEVKSFSEELSLLEVSDLVLSKLSEKPANIKFLAAGLIMALSGSLAMAGEVWTEEKTVDVMFLHDTHSHFHNFLFHCY